MQATQIDIYQHVVSLFDAQKIVYRILEHEAEGRTARASQLRGHELSQAAKALVIMVTLGKKERRYCLAVVPGHLHVDLNAIKNLYAGTRAMLAPQERAQQLTYCVMGAVPPFTFHRDLDLIADEALLDNTEIIISPGRLDRSIFMHIDAYVTVARPRWAQIAQA
jgi:Ala-tRNA(Pro) deacylase